jgi:hypothetical protein
MAFVLGESLAEEKSKGALLLHDGGELRERFRGLGYLEQMVETMWRVPIVKR